MSSQAGAQSLLQKQVNVEAKNKPLSEVLKAIGRQGNFYFSYNSNIIRKDSLVSVSAKSKTVKQVLDGLLGEDCKYVETDKYIIIQPSEKEKWYTISGFITDGQTGDALADVSVFERQQLVATITGKDGFFKLLLKDREKYRSAEIVVSKGFYVDTSISLLKGYDQEVSLAIAPETYSLPDLVVTQNTGVGKSRLGKWLLSSKLKTQNLNLGKFFVDKPYQFSLIPGLGTHGKMSGQVANKASFNILGGYTGGVEGVEIAGVFNINKKDVKYVQLAGMANIVAGNAEGFQASGFSNYVGGEVNGVQCAGMINKAGKVRGAQLGGFLNMAFDTVEGAQIGGFVNGAKACNAQVAGFVNVAESIDGAQVAGFVNVAKTVKGTQVAGFVNLAQELDGTQIAGFVNVAGKVRGVQVAAFLNLADSCDYPIGIINIIRKGDKAIGVSTDEYGTAVIALRSGGRVTYGIMGLAGNAQLQMYGLEIGYGAHLNIAKHFRINTEISALSIFDFAQLSYNDYAVRVLPAARFGPIEIFAGAGFNTTMYGAKPPSLVPVQEPFWTGANKVHSLEMRIGYKAGVQVHF